MADQLSFSPLDFAAKKNCIKRDAFEALFRASSAMRRRESVGLACRIALMMAVILQLFVSEASARGSRWSSDGHTSIIEIFVLASAFGLLCALLQWIYLWIVATIHGEHWPSRSAYVAFVKALGGSPLASIATATAFVAITPILFEIIGFYPHLKDCTPANASWLISPLDCTGIKGRAIVSLYDRLAIGMFIAMLCPFALVPCWWKRDK